jgi:type I restriction enzyme M protein
MIDATGSIEKLERDLREAADNLRANSKLTSSDYFMPVLGVIFLLSRRQPIRGRAPADRVRPDQR